MCIVTLPSASIGIPSKEDVFNLFRRLEDDVELEVCGTLASVNVFLLEFHNLAAIEDVI